jgi:hypothetical protein
MKKILLTICMVLSLSTAWAGNPSGKLRSLVSSFKHEPGFEVLDLGGLGMGLIRMAARAEADDPEDRQALELLRSIKRLTVLDFSDASPEKKEKFLRKANRILDDQEVLMEAKEDGETVRIYGVSSKDGSILEDIVLLTDEALVSVRGSIRSDQIGALMKQAGR